MINSKVRGTNSVFVAVTISVFLMLLGFASVGFAVAPVAMPESYTLVEDAVVFSVAAPGLLFNDTDDGLPNPPAAITAVKVTDPIHGDFVAPNNFSANGAFSYKPDPNYFGTDSFTYRVFDGAEYSNTVTVNINITAVNDVPTANNETYTAIEDTLLTVLPVGGVIANDTDGPLPLFPPGGDGPNALTAQLITNVTQGTLTLNANGSFTYMPNLNVNGVAVDSFTYRIFDGLALSVAIGTANINVTGVNDPPVATGDSYSTNEDTPLVVAAPGVLVNDVDGGNVLPSLVGDGPNATLTALLVTQPLHGTFGASWINDGSFTYTPTINYFGPDSFTYKAYDGALNSNIVTVNINVASVNDIPVANNDLAYATNEDIPLIVPVAGGLLANDTDGNTFPLYPPPLGDGPNPLTAIWIVASGPANGTLTLNANGSFTYVPNLNWSGVDTFTYNASDGAAISGAPGTVNITVTQVNDPPVAVNDGGLVYFMVEDGGPTVFASSVLTNDNTGGAPFLDGGPITAVLNGPLPLGTTTAGGAIVMNAGGTFTYTPAPNFFGVDTFTYVADDGTATVPPNPPTRFSTPATVTLTVTPDNSDRPVAVNDNYTATEDTALIIPAAGVLANDTDPDTIGGGLPPSATAIWVSGPTVAGSTVVLNANGSFTYTPAPNFFTGFAGVTDTFTYRVNDGVLDSLATATVTITVNGVNDPPVVTNDVYATNEDSPLVVAPSTPGVLNNDNDGGAPFLDGPNPTLLATLVNGPTNGTLTFNANGSFVYTPNTNWNGVDTFTYKANDGAAFNALPNAIVTITVNAVNDVPVANPDTYRTNEDTLLTVPVTGTPYNGVLFNDTDVEGGALTAYKIVNTFPLHGALVFNLNGSFTYMPAANFSGTDNFTYKANDSGGVLAGDSAATTVTIIVNKLPVAIPDSYTTVEDTLLTVAAPGVLVNDLDPDGPNPLTAILVTNVSNGTLTLLPAGSFTYMPNLNFNGTDSFTYKTNDSGGALAGDSNIVTVNIVVTPVNDAPVATGESYSTNEDIPLTVGSLPPAVSPQGVLVNDTDVDIAVLTAIWVSGPTAAQGVVALNANGSFTYTPTLNFYGTATFTYKANDGALDSNVVTVTITVNPINDPPVANPDFYSTNKNTAITMPIPPGGVGVGVIANDTDVEGSPLLAVLVSGPALAQGTVVLNANGSFIFTPALNFVGVATFTYKVNDGILDSNVATVTITVNDPPVAIGDSYSTNEDTPLTVAAPGVLVNDSDPDGIPAPITAMLVSGPTVAQGTVALNANGSFTYTPTLDFNGTATFTYKANDSAADSNVATVTIAVAPVNDAPVAVNDVYSASQLSVGVPGVVAAPGVLANDTDVETNPLIIATKVTDPANGTITVWGGDGSFTYVPTSNYSGPDSFTYKANDGALDSNIATVSLTIPPAFTVTSPVGSVPGNVIVNFSVNIWRNITGATLYYKQGGAASYSPVVLTQSGMAWSGNIPAADVTARGLLYYVDAVNGATHYYYQSASAPANISVHANSSFAFYTTPSGHLNVWNMISPNGDPDDTNLRSVVGPVFNEGSGGTWIAYDWDPSVGVAGDWRRLPNTTGTFVPGRAWFFAKDGGGSGLPSSAPFYSTSVSAAVPYEITLPKGYSLVANPFAFPVAWSDSTIIINYGGNDYTPTAANTANIVGDKAIWLNPLTNAYIKKSSNAAVPFTMMPNQGQWTYSAVVGAKMIIKPIYQTPTPIDPGTPVLPAPKNDKTSWNVTLSLQSSAGSDSITASVGKSTGNVGLDQIKSPVMPFAPYIAFSREDQVGAASRLSSDVRAINDELTWSINATASSEVTLNWSLVNVPDDYMLSLDDQAGKVVNLSQDSAIHLGVGVHSFILKAEKKTLIPKATKLLANYPNPFNPETWIPYELSKNTDVSIKIYSSSGQLVRSLELGHKMAGFYSSKDKAAHWDGKNEAGEQVSSGIYFYNIQAGGYKDIRKMVIMK